MPKQVSGSILQQVEKLNCPGWYLRVTGLGWHLRVTESVRKKLIHGWVKGMQFYVSFYCSVVTKRELSNTAKFSVFKSVFFPILTFGHESWIITERILSQLQAGERGFLRRVHRDKVRSCENRTALPILFSESRDPSCVGSAMCPECPRKYWRGKSCLIHHEKAAQSSPCLAPSWCEASATMWDCSWSLRISNPPTTAAFPTLPRGKAGMKNEQISYSITYSVRQKRLT